jgi:enoyl-CoA hydratase/3-hydroxyacyl-CoA dehydrogenase
MNQTGLAKAVGLAEAFCTAHGAALSKSLAAQRAVGRPWTLRVVDLAVADGIATITVNRPEALNALNEAVVEQLASTFDAAAAQADVRAIVIEGSGKAFIAGADIKYFIDNIEAGTLSNVVEFTRGGQRLLRKLETCTKPVIAKVDGLALGGGFELAMACTAMVVTEKTVLGLPETGIGIYPGLGGSQRTPRIVGKALGKYLVFTGQTLDGKTAHELGLAAYFAPSAEANAFIRNLLGSGPVADKYAPKPMPKGWEALADAFSDAHVAEILSGKAPNSDPRVEKAAKAISRKAPLALSLVNRIMDEGLQKDIDAAIQLELDHVPEIFATKDALLGLKSIGVYQPQFAGE